MILRCVNIAKLKSKLSRFPRTPFPVWHWVKLIIKKYTLFMEGTDKALPIAHYLHCHWSDGLPHWCEKVAKLVVHPNSPSSMSPFCLWVLGHVPVQIPDEETSFFCRWPTSLRLEEMRHRHGFQFVVGALSIFSRFVCTHESQFVLMGPSLSLLYIQLLRAPTRPSCPPPKAVVTVFHTSSQVPLHDP